MKQKLTIVLVSTTAFTIDVFMLSHIKKLSNYYDLLIFCNNATSLKKKVPNNVSLVNLNFHRKPNLIIDLKTFLMLTYLMIKKKTISNYLAKPESRIFNCYIFFYHKSAISYSLVYRTSLDYKKRFSS